MIIRRRRSGLARLRKSMEQSGIGLVGVRGMAQAGDPGSRAYLRGLGEADSFTYPPGVTDPDGYDAQTYLEGRTGDAMAAAARIDRRAARRKGGRKSMFGPKARALKAALRSIGFSGVSIREAVAIQAEVEAVFSYGEALGFARHEMAAAVLKVRELHPSLSYEQVEQRVKDVMAEGRITPSRFRPETVGQSAEQFGQRVQDVLRDYPSAAESVRRMGAIRSPADFAREMDGTRKSVDALEKKILDLGRSSRSDDHL